MKEIKDFLPYYLGQSFVFDNRKWTISSIGKRYVTGQQHSINRGWNTIDVYHNECKPVLRRLSDMTEQEAEEGNLWSEWHDNVLCMQGWEQKGYLPDQFHYLLKQGFDLFGLIDKGLAVDIKTI